MCHDALAETPEARPTARELDGDRDVEQRRMLAAQQLESAHEALAAGGIDAHATAVRRAGRALALDPENEDAAALVGKLTRLLARPAIIWTWCVLAIAMPIVLELVGVLPRQGS